MTKRSDSSLSYFERLTFDAKLKGDAIWNYISNMRIVTLSVIAILFLGIVSYLSIPRRLNPEIKISIVTVVTVLPGASPADVESLVTIPLETGLQNIAGIDVLSSSSQSNVSAITMQFLSTITQDKARADVQSVVDGISTLPKDALTPTVKALDFEDEPIWTFALSGPDLPSLMHGADILKKNLENTPKVDRVILNGFETQEIAVVIKPEAIRQYGINPALLSSAVKSSIISYPAGSVTTGEHEFALTIDPQITSIEDIRSLKLKFGTASVSLGDIARVQEQSSKNQKASYIASKSENMKRVVTFRIHKSTSANIDEAALAVHKMVDSTLAAFGPNFNVTTVTDAAKEIDDQFFDLLGEFRSTIILVFACLFIFLGLRQAVIASITVPLTFLAAFVFMRYIGMSINFLSMFAFLLALGLLVDDTIVVVSAMTTYYKTKKFTPLQTGRIVWRDTIVPIWSTTITTIWSFVPLLLATGIIGSFIKPIPVVVTVTMISSTAIAVLITLPFMIVILKPEIAPRVILLGKIIGIGLLSVVILSLFKTNPLFPIIVLVYIAAFFIFTLLRPWIVRKLPAVLSHVPYHKEFAMFGAKTMDHGLLDIEILAKKYHWLISKILASKKARKFIVIGIVFYAIWAFALLPMGYVKNEFFPKDDQDTIYLNLELPAGSTTIATSDHTQELVNKVRSIPEISFVTADAGINVGGRGSSGGDALSGLTLHLKSKKERSRTSIQIASDLRQQFAHYSAGTVTVVELSGGPPAGSDLQMKLLGDDLGQLNAYADTIASHLSQTAGVSDVSKSIKSGTSKLVFVPDQAKMQQYGVTVDTLGLWLRSFASGFTLSDAKFDTSVRNKKDIIFSFDDGMQSPETIGTIMIATNQGNVPLLSLGTMMLKNNPTVITRESGKRTISVSAAVKAGFNTAQINSELEKYVDSLHMKDGYSWKTGGVNDENRKSVQSILQAMVLAFILILVTMVIQFQSYRQALLVLLVIPLAVSSVFFVFALTGIPLSFPALIGVLSLFGIVVTNSMFIVDKINMNIRQGMPFSEAIADAGASRMEPIILTKLCTVLGLLPITFSNALWQGLGGAIISGLLIASSIMLLFIPVVYYEWFKGDYGIKG
jgi:multidrug efflux pump